VYRGESVRSARSRIDVPGYYDHSDPAARPNLKILRSTWALSVGTGPAIATATGHGVARNYCCD
jgi:hypothetical protein